MNPDDKPYTKGYKDGYRRGIEDAAKVAEGMFYGEEERKCGCIPQKTIAEKIRAVISK
jgi:hypothetical protein